MLQESETATPVRVTYDEARLIRPGFRRLISAHYRWKERGSSPISPARGRAIPISDPKDEGEFSPEWQAIILHVAVVATNNFKAQSRRLHLNRVELAACILGVRATEMMARHGHLEPKPTDFKVRCRRLLKKLERLRKRAKRAYIRVHGRAAFKRASHRWQQYVQFARAFFLYCTCNRTLLPDPSGRRLRKLREDEWIEFFQKELPVRSLEIPPEPGLRGLVNKTLRVGRWFIRQHGRIAAHKNHDHAPHRLKNRLAQKNIFWVDI